MRSNNHPVEHVPAPDDSHESLDAIKELAKEAFFSGSVETIDAVIDMLSDGRGLLRRGTLSMAEALVTEVARLETIKRMDARTICWWEHRRAEWKW